MCSLLAIPPSVRRLVSSARVGHFASSNAAGPGLVPVCFVLAGDTVYHALDAKPKSIDPRRLARVRNISVTPEATFLVDHYDEDWRRLWYVLFRGSARVLEEGEEQQRAIRALRRKYRQYRRELPLPPAATVIALDVRRFSYWRSSSATRSRGAGPAARPS